MDNTITYYNTNAAEYYNKTITAEMSSVYNHFTRLLKSGSCICDLGCGSGRDSKYFISQGFTVLPIDGSHEMCRLASELLKQKVDCLEFDDIDYENEFDAIWACSSLLHVPKNALSHIIEKLIRSAKNNAVIYTCFKLGNSERIIDGRFFSDYTHDEILDFISKYKCLKLIEIWISDDVRGSHGRSQWLNIIVRIIKGNL
ncbi:MAG: class I SAM-dependent methyltransferase [Tannerellaceae bacterium]|jgi:SAM-dependent methyltransferase|nr:class I SAM-dependent methyltransferase [Tannerellaceae bacterium]